MDYLVKTFPLKRRFAEETFVPTRAWSVAHTEAYNCLKQTSLLLHPYEGWQSKKDFSFLKDLWRIESFRLFNTNETDLTPLYEKQELKKIELLRVLILKKKPGFDLGKFPNLKVFAGDWMPGITNLEKATGLEELEIWGLTGIKHWNLTTMPKLAALEVHGARGVESLDVSGLTNLRSITLLAMPKLTEIRGIEDPRATSESWLNIDGCKRLSASFLRRFANAELVTFQGKLIVKKGENVRPWPDEMPKRQ